MMEPATVREQRMRDAAAIQALCAIVWLTDVIGAYAAGARWNSYRFLLPSAGLVLAAGWSAFAIAVLSKRRLPSALAILTAAGAFLLWTYRVSSLQSRVVIWAILTLILAATPFVIARLGPRVTMILAPLLVVGYHTGKSIVPAFVGDTLRRELPAIAFAAGLAVIIAIISRTAIVRSPRLHSAIAGVGVVVAIIGFAAVIAWSGVSFPIITRGTAARREPPRGASNVVMIMIDTLRADRLGVYGYRVRPTSPFIDSLAARGLIYRNAYATSSWTVPSIATMFTGQAPEQHGVIVYGVQLPAGVPTLAEKLRARGYTTTAVVANDLINARHGFARGFERFALLTRMNDQTRVPSLIWSDVLLVGHYWMPSIFAKGTSKPEAAKVIDESLRAIENAPRNRPLFLYMHLLDPHNPCDAPPSEATRDWKPVGEDEPFDRRWSVEYDREVRYVDDQIRRFADAAKSRLGENTVFVIVADHGEQLGESGRRGHGSNLEEPVIRVPLIVVRPNGQRNEINDLFNLTHLAPLIETAATAAPDETVRTHLIPPGSAEIAMNAVQNRDWKLVTTDVRANRREQLFRLPDEARDHLAQQPAVAATLRLTRDAVPPIKVPRILDAEARANLRALGYIR